MIVEALRASIASDSWGAITRTDMLLVRHDSDCGYVHNERAYAPLSDTVGDWAEALGLRVQSVAAPYSRLSGDAAAHTPVTLNRAMLATALAGRVVRAAKGVPRGTAWADARRTALWKKLLRRAAPRIVIGINPDPALCRAGRHLAIPVFDLQHGLIGNGTPWYATMATAPAGADYLPAGILCWDEGSAAEVTRWAAAHDVAVPILGNPWVARFLEPAPEDELVASALTGLPGTAGERPRILVSLQWGLADLYYREASFNGVMVDALEKAILATADRFQWLLRLHPVQLRGGTSTSVRGYLERTFGALPGVEWQISSVMALPALLRSVAAHVTDSSSVVAEAARMGIPSAMLNLSLGSGGIFEHGFAEERKAGLAELIAQDSGAIVRWIEDRLRGSPAALPASGGRAAWMAFLDQFVMQPGSTFTKP